MKLWLQPLAPLPDSGRTSQLLSTPTPAKMYDL